MFRFPLHLLFLFVGPHLLAQQGARVVTTITKSDHPPWKKWKNDACSMNYPSAWAVDPTGTTGPLVVFLSPLDSNDVFRENVSLSVVPAKGRALEGCSQDAEHRVKEMKNGTLLLSENTPNNDAHYLEYTGEQDGMAVKCRQEIIVRNDTVYTITYTAEPKAYEDAYFLAEAVFNSFTFLK